jgi:hypothetical protein
MANFGEFSNNSYGMASNNFEYKELESLRHENKQLQLSLDTLHKDHEFLLLLCRSRSTKIEVLENTVQRLINEIFTNHEKGEMLPEYLEDIQYFFHNGNTAKAMILVDALIISLKRDLT